jgi:hypothetical protein
MLLGNFDVRRSGKTITIASRPFLVGDSQCAVLRVIRAKYAV